MKKILLASTALMAVTAVSAAQAQESAMMSAAGNDITIGGYYEFGYVTGKGVGTGNKGDQTDLEKAQSTYTYGDSELYIDFQNVADNGLVYGVQIDIELINGSRHTENFNNKTAEEASIFLRGDWGSLDLGHDDTGMSRHILSAPTHEGTLGQDDSILSINRGHLVNPGSASGLYDDDAKIVYSLPSFSPIKASISWSDGVVAQKEDANGNNITSDDRHSNGHAAAGVSWKGQVLDVVGGVDLGLYYGFLSSLNSVHDDQGDEEDLANSDKTKLEHYGISIDVIGITLTYGSTKEQTGIVDYKQRTINEIGIGYKINDAFSVGLAMGTAKGSCTTRCVAGAAADRLARQKAKFTSVSASYNIAPGLKATLAVNNASFDNREKDKKANPDPKSTSSVVAQLEFAF